MSVSSSEKLLGDFIAREVECVCWTCPSSHHSYSSEESTRVFRSDDLRESLEQIPIFCFRVGYKCHHPCLEGGGEGGGGGWIHTGNEGQTYSINDNFVMASS